MARRIRACDWAATPLGPIEGWSERLKLLVEQVLASPLVSTLVCGPQHLLIYNDAAARNFGDRHPEALGHSLSQVFPEGWATVSPYYVRAFAGETVQVRGQSLDTRGEGAATDMFDALLAPVRESDGSFAYVHMTGAEVSNRAQIEALLRESEARHRLLIGSWAQAVWETDAQGVVVADSPSWRAYTGQTLEEWLGYGWLDAIHPDDRTYAERHWREAIADRRLVDAEFRIHAPGGGWRWTNVRAAPVLDAEGKIEKWAVMNIDIDARKCTEAALQESQERQAFLLDLGDQMRRQADADATIATASRLLGEHLRASRIVFAEIDDDAGLAHVRQGWTADNAPMHPAELRLSDFGDPLLDDLRAGRTVQFDDVGEPPFARPDLAALHAIGIKAGLSVPLVLGGRFVVNLNVHQDQPRSWTTATVALVQDVAERIWAAVQRARAEAALRESEGRLAAAFESMPAGVAAVDAEGRTMVANGQFRLYVPTNVLPSHDVRARGRWRGWDEQGRPLDARNFPGARALRGESLIPGQDMLYTDETGREIWTNVATAPTRDAAGRITGAVIVVSDIDERKRTGEALRLSEERFQQFSEASPDILWSRDAATLQWDYLSPAFEAVYGLSRKEALEGNDLRRWLELIEPEDRGEALACMRRVRGGERITFEYRIRRPVDNQVRWIRNTDFPIFDRSGRVHRIGGIGQDITELQVIEAALAHSEQRLRTLVEGMSQLVWRAIDNGDWTWASPQWTAFTGQAEPDSHHLGWLDPVHPDDHPVAMAAWAHALRTGGFAVEFRIRNARDGEYRWFQTRATPVRDAAGVVTEWLGTSTDIHELRSLQERQKVLVAELQHRTRNLMGVVRAMAETTLRSSTDLADFGHRYRDRLDALSRVQSLLSRLEGVARITFDELIESEFRAIGAINGSSGKVVLNGPAGVALRSSTVQTFALALHELATNAVKYGALASPSGHLAVTWRLEHAQPGGVPWLHVDWHESGVTMPPGDARPQGTGQGRRLIERALPYQLGAETTYVMGADGVRCSIALPVSSRTTAGDEDERPVPTS